MLQSPWKKLFIGFESSLMSPQFFDRKDWLTQETEMAKPAIDCLVVNRITFNAKIKYRSNDLRSSWKSFHCINNLTGRSKPIFRKMCAVAKANSYQLHYMKRYVSSQIFQCICLIIAGNSENSNSSFGLINQTWSAGQGRWFTRSTVPLWDPTCIQPYLGTPLQDRCGPGTVSPELGDKNYQGGGTPLL